MIKRFLLSLSLLLIFDFGRFDSDLRALYGKVVKRKHPITKNYLGIWNNKTKTAAWMVSHCKSFGKREEYVKQLQKFIDVDIYGGCSKDQVINYCKLCFFFYNSIS